ncbi:MAG: ExbD/TolR family protein [Nitrospinae bacterium]|nr:ExbD/TolR family protein [Nitrospinota bacterium]
MAIRSSKTIREMSEINVIPFVDVMLVLLVIFMVTTPLMQHGIDIQLPRESARGVELKDATVITITQDREIYIGDKSISLNELEVELKGRYKGRTDKEIFLKADREIPYGFVVKAMARIKGAGIERLGMITEPVE